MTNLLTHNPTQNSEPIKMSTGRTIQMKSEILDTISLKAITVCVILYIIITVHFEW